MSRNDPLPCMTTFIRSKFLLINSPPVALRSAMKISFFILGRDSHLYTAPFKLQFGPGLAMILFLWRNYTPFLSAKNSVLRRMLPLNPPLLSMLVKQDLSGLLLRATLLPFTTSSIVSHLVSPIAHFATQGANHLVHHMVHGPLLRSHVHTVKSVAKLAISPSTASTAWILRFRDVTFLKSMLSNNVFPST